MTQNLYEQIKEEILNYLDSIKYNYTKQRFEFKITGSWFDDNIYMVEVYGYHKDEYEPNKQTSFILLRFIIYYEYKQVQISNIFLPNFMKHKGIGKKLIYKIFVISEREQYELFIVDMVDSFYQKMIARGALPCNCCDDAVKIVNETKLL